MLSQYLLDELQEILEQTCSRKFEKGEVADIATNLCCLCESLAEAYGDNQKDENDKK
jgi:hypothetical protein